MIISLIAAMAENRVIGRDNKMPWDIPADRKRFHAITRGRPIILGRKTFESIGRPLSGRKNIVLTRRKDYHADDVVVAHDLESVFAVCGNAEEVFVCGGGEVFRETIHRADRIYLTVIHATIAGDTFFPEIPPEFREVERTEIEGKPSFAYVRYERMTSGNR